MKTNTLKRTSALVVLFLSLFFVPWWVGITLGMLFVLFFENPYEIFIYGIFLDGLYGVSHGGFISSHIFFVGTAIFLTLSIWIKEHLMFSIS